MDRLETFVGELKKQARFTDAWKETINVSEMIFCKYKQPCKY